MRQNPPKCHIRQTSIKSIILKIRYLKSLRAPPRQTGLFPGSYSRDSKMKLFTCTVHRLLIPSNSQSDTEDTGILHPFQKTNPSTQSNPATQLGGALAGLFFLYGLGQNPAAGKNVDTSRFWIICEDSQNCRQIIGTPPRNIFHAPKSSQMPYTTNINKINNFNNKIKNPLELRLERIPAYCTLSRTESLDPKQPCYTHRVVSRLILSRQDAETVHVHSPSFAN